MAGDERAGAAGATRLLQDAAAADAVARERVAGASVDLFLPARSRLSDYQRSAVARLLDGLVAEVEAELRAALAPGLRQAASAELARAVEGVRTPIAAPILARAGALADRELIECLILRVDEHRATGALRLEADAGGEPSPIDGWLHDPDRAVSTAASALLVAQGRRVGAAHEPLLPRADLPAEQQHRLVWRVAAALRHHLLGDDGLAAAEADRLIEAAVPAALARCDEGEAVHACALQLARALGDRGDDAALVALVRAGEVALVAAVLAVRVRIDLAASLAMLLDAGGARAALLLVAAGVARAPAAEILLRLALALGADEERAASLAEAMAALDPAAAREAVRPFGLDRDYRAAIALIEAAPAGDGYAA